MMRIYNTLEKGLIVLQPLWQKIGYERAEKPVALIEKGVKGLLFDCQMCGQCALSDTGMSCPMNCPKQLRNGPCGGVRENGHCEVKPEMRCVWVEAYRGRGLLGTDQSKEVFHEVDYQKIGQSSWLNVVKKHQAEQAAAAEEKSTKQPKA